MERIEKRYDVIIVGGGLSGLCAAIASARGGARTALVQERPVLGGNASSEIRMHICGADIHGFKENARETGIVEELMLTNRIQNPQHSFCVQDYAFESVARKEKNLDLYLNTRMISSEVEGNKIRSITALQATTEKTFLFVADYFIDATGDGFLGFTSGAEYMYGREGNEAFNEPHAPAEPDKEVMGSSLLFSARDMGRPVPFVKPEWAYSYTEEDLSTREHGEISSGYWWIEWNTEDSIGDGEEIRLELMKMLFGVWDHIKNGGDHGAENYALDWIGALPGKRESRRLVGDYVLRETDLYGGKTFFDAVAYGGWSMDLHTPGGLMKTTDAPNVNVETDHVYQIPYRCLYSKNIDNLFLAGRAISVSHMAFGSTRVMGTCAVIGQAVGKAAAMCVEKKVSPRALLAHIGELQQGLLLDDCYIPHIPLSTEGDLAKTASITASSVMQGYGVENLVGGYTRPVGRVANCFQTEGIAKEGEWIAMRWKAPQKIGRVCLRFDSNCSKEITISLSERVQKRQRAFPIELVKDFDLTFTLAGKEVKRIEKRNNFLRFCDIEVETVADEVKLTVYTTYGAEKITLFGMGIYAE